MTDFNARFGSRIEICCACRRGFEIPPIPSILRVPHLCLSCLLWRERDEQRHHSLAPADIRVESCLYVLDSQEERGQAVDIRFLQGGHLRTRRLRFVAIIPDHLRLVLSDNAIVTFPKP